MEELVYLGPYNNKYKYVVYLLLMSLHQVKTQEFKMKL